MYKPFVKTTNPLWKPFLTDTMLPDSGLKYLNTLDAFRGYGGPMPGMIWYQGETPETATKWAVVMDDGSYYKVHAKYAFWRPNTEGELTMFCYWSDHSLKKALKAYLDRGETLRDPDYQT